MKQGILFDLDGTLWDSAQAVVDSWNEIIETLPDFHKLITNEDMCQLMGKTMDDIAYTYFNTVSKERALEILQICMDHENAYIEQHGGVLFPGLEEVLKELSENMTSLSSATASLAISKPSCHTISLENTLKIRNAMDARSAAREIRSRSFWADRIWSRQFMWEILKAISFPLHRRAFHLFTQRTVLAKYRRQFTRSGPYRSFLPWHKRYLQRKTSVLFCIHRS